MTFDVIRSQWYGPRSIWKSTEITADWVGAVWAGKNPLTYDSYRCLAKTALKPNEITSFVKIKT